MFWLWRAGANNITTIVTRRNLNSDDNGKENFEKNIYSEIWRMSFSKEGHLPCPSGTACVLFICWGPNSSLIREKLHMFVYGLYLWSRSPKQNPYTCVYLDLQWWGNKYTEHLHPGLSFNLNFNLLTSSVRLSDFDLSALLASRRGFSSSHIPSFWF